MAADGIERLNGANAFDEVNEIRQMNYCIFVTDGINGTVRKPKKIDRMIIKGKIREVPLSEKCSFFNIVQTCVLEVI